MGTAVRRRELCQRQCLYDSDHPDKVTTIFRLMTTGETGTDGSNVGHGIMISSRCVRVAQGRNVSVR